MMRRRQNRRNRPPDHVEPDLPITPMLDMFFQVLAFFVATFTPISAEGHLEMALPLVQGGGSAVPPPVLEEEPEELIVKLESTPDGDLKEIVLSAKGVGSGLALPNRAALIEELKKRLKEKGPSKVKLEIDEKLVYELVVYTISDINRAGYKQIAPALLLPPKK